MPNLRQCPPSQTKVMKPELIEDISRGITRMVPYLTNPSDEASLRALLASHAEVETRPFHWYRTALWDVLAPLPALPPPAPSTAQVLFERDRPGHIRGLVREEDIDFSAGTRSRPRKCRPPVPASSQYVLPNCSPSCCW